MDDEEELVREVISENPPEDRGVRPEWESHQGWHRVEDTHPNDHGEGKPGDNLLTDQNDAGNHALRVADRKVNDDDPLEPSDEGKQAAKSNDPIAEGIAPGTTNDFLKGDGLKREMVPQALPRTVRGVNVERGNIAYERTTNIRKPLTIGLAAVVFFAYVTFQRRRMMKSTKDML